ncbi:SIMPL domain-containing protein [Candidatus Bathyarchaeota archaeon]|nr:SIMPL domain-containing protein [Candidatus Bathyarchaeota archaeon]
MKPDWRQIEVLLICISIIASALILAQGLRRGGSAMEVSLSTPTLSTLTRMSGELSGKTITVTGFGEASGKADLAVITLGVETEDASAGDAVQENAMRMSNVIEALKNLGVDEDSMETSSFQVYRIYDDQGNPKGYRVINSLKVKTMKLDQVGRIIDVAIEAGANKVESIHFTLSDEKMENLKREAYLKAVRDAKEKAKLITEELGIKITGIYSVSESLYRPYTHYDMKLKAITEATSTPIIKGTITISTSIQIIYNID